MYIYVCAHISERACTETYVYAAWIFTYFMIAANTQQPNIFYVMHDMHLNDFKIMTNVFRRPRAFNLLHGRICKGRTQLHMQMCPGRHNCILQQHPSGHDCICKIVRRTLLICNNVLRLILHRGHNCMRHRLGTFFRFLTKNSTS